MEKVSTHYPPIVLSLAGHPIHPEVSFPRDTGQTHVNNIDCVATMKRMKNMNKKRITIPSLMIFMSLMVVEKILLKGNHIGLVEDKVTCDQPGPEQQVY